MSFWDDLGSGIAGLFTGDDYFPDNPKREHRAKELAEDCQNIAGQLTSLVPQLQQKLKNLNESLASLYGNPDKLLEDAEPSKIQFGEWGVEVAQLIAPLVAVPVVASALTTAATSYLVSTGEIGAAAFAELVGLPAAFEIGIGAAAGVVAIGIGIGIGAIAGAVKRDKLRDAIHGCVSSRLKLQKALLVDKRLSLCLDALQHSLDTLGELKKEDGSPLYSNEQIVNAIKVQVRTAQEKLGEIDDQDARDVLSALDKGRGSWINED